MSVHARRLERLLIALAVAGLSACTGLPPRGPAEDSAAFTDTQTTTLGQIAAGSTPVGHSAFGLLPTGDPAFGARSALAARAERSLDVQYYHLHSDPAGTEFLRELRDASRRGVRVRLLVDDLHAVATYPLLKGLAAYAGVQVRLFNPLPTREGDIETRLVASMHVFGQVNSRMHNKLFVADNAVAIFGGRNIADEYFMRHGEANFVDLDVIAAGPVVQDLSHSFDSYWNSERAYPLDALFPTPADLAQARGVFDQAADAVDLRRLRQVVDQSSRAPITAQLVAGHLDLHPGNASVYSDPPSKAWPSQSRKMVPWSTAFSGVTEMIASAQSDVLVVSPYFVPMPRGMNFMKVLASRGVRMRVYTNSLGSTDELRVHAAYSKYRAAMLRLGVELYEFSPDAVRGSGRFGHFGESIARLHTKLAIVDGHRLAAGSTNMDGRSAFFNTELAVVIDCTPLAEEAMRLILGDYQSSMYRLRLAEDGSTIEWLLPDADGTITRTTEEPHVERISSEPEGPTVFIEDDLL